VVTLAAAVPTFRDTHIGDIIFNWFHR